MTRIIKAGRHAGLALLEGVLIATLLVGLVAGTTLAAKGGGGGKGGGGSTTTTSSATVKVNPNPVGVGVSYTISGSGYKAGAPLDVKLYTSTATVVLFTGADTAGAFSISNTTWSASAVKVEVWQYTGSWSLKATTSFTVQ